MIYVPLKFTSKSIENFFLQYIREKSFYEKISSLTDPYFVETWNSIHGVPVRFSMSPISKIGCIFILSCLSFRHSLILSFCPPIWNFLVIRPFRGYHYFLSCDLGVWQFFLENFNLANNFWTVSAGALIFYMSFPCRGYHYFFYPVTLTLEFDPFLDNLNLANNFRTVSVKAKSNFL